ncbi:isochorismatase family protein [Enterobacter sichuanensis]
MTGIHQNGATTVERGRNSFSVECNDVVFMFADFHTALLKNSTTMSPESLVANAAGLASVAQSINAPTIFLTVPVNGKPAETAPELVQFANETNTFFRVHADPFLVDEIVHALQATGRKTLIISGFSAEIAVLLSALGGLRHAYRIFIPIDCTASRSLRTETVALQQAKDAGAVLTTLATLAAQLGPDFSRSPGTTMLTVISNVRI